MVLFPETYPHSGGDQVFIANELKVLSPKFEKITIIHFGEPKGEKVDIPENAKVFYFSEIPKVSILTLLKENALIEIIISEFLRLPIITFFKKLRYMIALFKKVLSLYDIGYVNGIFGKEALYYSFWMNEKATLLAFAKRKKKINRFIFRLHGYDLYDEYRPDEYIPFRDFNFKYVTKAFTVSEFGLNYLKPKLKYPEKLENSYLGTFDHGLNPIDPNKNVLVSCSSINIRKRVDLIVRSLSYIKDLNIHWIHFGGKGDWGDEKKLHDYAKSLLPSNITWEIKGAVSNQELIKFYQTQSVSAFIHLSANEGGPSIACIEAISFGIPLIAAPNGGLRETINPKTGIVLEKSISKQCVANAIRNVFSEKYQNIRFRNGIKEYWNNTFEAERNSLTFIQKIKN